jgi:spore coat polysaccharide biosynthesis predicted glycosyltransferase SpsG
VGPDPGDALRAGGRTGADAIVLDDNDAAAGLCRDLRKLAPVVNLAPQKLPKWYADLTINATSHVDMAEPADSLPARRWHRGPEYAFLRGEFVRRAAGRDTGDSGGREGFRGDGQRVLVAMGAGDEPEPLCRVLAALDRLSRVGSVTVAAGAAFRSRPALEQAARAMRVPCELRYDSNDMVGLMRRHDWAASAMGLTTLEMLHCGLPTVVLALTPFHLHLARELEAHGAAVAVDAITGAWETGLIKQWGPVCGSPQGLAGLRRNGQRLIDGGGALRAADLVIGLASSCRRQTCGTIR